MRSILTTAFFEEMEKENSVHNETPAGEGTENAENIPASEEDDSGALEACLLYTSPSPRDI